MSVKQGGLLATAEREQKLMSGGRREKLFEEISFFLDDRVSAEELELFEKREDMEEILKERWRTNAEEWRVSDAVRSGVTCKAASGSQSSMAEVGLSDEPEVGVNRKGKLEDQSFVCSVEASQKKRRAVIRKESAETQDFVSWQDMEEGNDKSLEEIGFVPRPVGEPLLVKHMCDKKCEEMGFARRK